MCGSDGSDPDSMLTLYRTAPHSDSAAHCPPCVATPCVAAITHRCPRLRRRAVVSVCREPVPTTDRDRPGRNGPARLHRSDRYPLPATGHHPLAAHQQIRPSRDLSVEELGGHRQPSTGPTRNRSEPSPSATPIPPTGPITAWQRLSIFWHTQHLQCGESRVDGVGLATAPCLTTGHSTSTMVRPAPVNARARPIP